MIANFLQFPIQIVRKRRMLLILREFEKIARWKCSINKRFQNQDDTNGTERGQTGSQKEQWKQVERCPVVQPRAFVILLLGLLHAGVQVMLPQLWVMSVAQIIHIYFWLTWAHRNLLPQGKYFLLFFQTSSHLIFVILSSYRFVWTFIIRYDLQIILYHPCLMCFMFLFLGTLFWLCDFGLFLDSRRKEGHGVHFSISNFC